MPVLGGTWDDPRCDVGGPIGGQECHLTCNPGYGLPTNGPDKVTCLEYGTYGSALPTCVPGRHVMLQMYAIQFRVLIFLVLFFFLIFLVYLSLSIMIVGLICSKIVVTIITFHIFINLGQLK